MAQGRITQATISYAGQVYEELVRRAALEETEGAEVLVYRGKITEVFNYFGLSQNYYTSIKRIFDICECITYLQKGTNAYPSVVVLNRPPPASVEELPLKLRERILPEDLTAEGEFARLRAQVETLTAWRETLGGINLGEAVRNIERRLSRLEKATAKTGE